MYDMGMKKIKSKPLFPQNIKLDGFPPALKTPHLKKDRQYWQTNLKPLGDFDRDGKSNVIDCYPYDPSRQGIAEIKEKVSEVGGKLKQKFDERKEKKEEKIMGELEQSEREESFRYILVKYFDGNWVNLGAFTVENLDEEMYQIQQNPDIEAVQVTKDQNLATKLNRQMMMSEAKEKVVHTAKEAGKYALKVGAEAAERATRAQDIAPRAAQNIRSGTQIKSSADMQQFASGPSGRPPRRAVNVPSGRPRASIGTVGKVSTFNQLRKAGENMEYKSPVENRPFVDEQQYGYSQRSPNYQEVSDFGPAVVPYRPIARRQVTVPNRPAKAPAWGSTIIDLGRSQTGRPIGMIPMAKFKFQKPIMLKFGYRMD